MSAGPDSEKNSVPADVDRVTGPVQNSQTALELEDILGNDDVTLRFSMEDEK